MTQTALTQFSVIGDKRGQLVALEAGRNVPFEIRRVYYITGMNFDRPRGFHAHRELRQLAICLAGSCKILLDDGKRKDELTLASPSVGVLIDRMVWHEMRDFSPDCVFMVLASDLYDEKDYIRDYFEFQRAVGDV